MPAIEAHLIQSRHVEQTFRVQVMLPANKPGETTRFPTVYVTDANLAFDMLKGISCILQSNGRDAPRYILVGIGYPGESPFAGAVPRARDLTHPGYPRVGPETGGAPRFGRFVEEELIPFIDASYPTIAATRTYFGHSAGGAFGLFMLFGGSGAFRNYIISSPGLTFHGVTSAGARYDNDDFGLEEARRFIAAGASLEGVKIYLSAGEKEEFEPALAGWRLTSSVLRMASLMAAAEIAGLDLTTEIFPGETHASAWPISFMHGVQVVLGSGSWGTRHFTDGRRRLE